MPDPISAKDVDLTPIPGKSQLSIDREWREHFTYSPMIDRFQYAVNHPIADGTGRASGVDTPDAFFDGKIAGATRNLDDITGLGCTAIWISPIFECNSHHGRDITNYLEIDSQFATIKDLVDPAEAAHDYVKNDISPENQRGDIASLKDYANDDDQLRSDVMNTLIAAHAYWIREADVDGFRVDAVKHLGELACSRLCSNIRCGAVG